MLNFRHYNFMKTKTLFLAIIMSAFVQLSMAQSTNNLNGAYINGLCVGNTYTKAQILEALGGKPSAITPPSETDEYQNAYTFRYGNDVFYWIGGDFYGGDIKSDKFVFQNNIRVGSNISVLKECGVITKDSKDNILYWKPKIPNKYSWEWLSVTIRYNAENIITEIDVFINDI